MPGSGGEGNNLGPVLLMLLRVSCDMQTLPWAAKCKILIESDESTVLVRARWWPAIVDHSWASESNNGGGGQPGDGKRQNDRVLTVIPSHFLLKPKYDKSCRPQLSSHHASCRPSLVVNLDYPPHSFLRMLSSFMRKRKAHTALVIYLLVSGTLNRRTEKKEWT